LSKLFKYWTLIVIGISDPLSLRASDTCLATISNLKARSLAMGGAFMASCDDLAALSLNPAAFSLRPFSSKTKTLSVYLNPMAPVLLGTNQVDLSEWNLHLGYLVKGVSFSTGRLNFGVIFGEEVLMDEERVSRGKMFKDSRYIHQRNTSFGFSLKFSPRVSVGFAGEFFTREKNEKTVTKMGYRYGLFLKPKPNLSASICFIDFPNAYDEDRLPLERLVDETLNIGLSFAPRQWMTISADIRNVSDEGKKAVREPHMGLELTPVRHLALRGGYFKNNDTNVDSYSVGLGIADLNAFLPESRRFEHSTFIVNAAMLWQTEKLETKRWFVLSTVLRF